MVSDLLISQQMDRTFKSPRDIGQRQYPSLGQPSTIGVTPTLPRQRAVSEPSEEGLFRSLTSRRERHSCPCPVESRH